MARAAKTIANVRACILPRGATFGDRRYRYKNWWCLTPSEKAAVRNRYPYKTPGIPDSAFAYPIDKSGKLASARRTLMWSLRETHRRTGRERAV